MSNEDKPVQPVAGELPPLPAGFSVTRVEGHGWYIDPPQGGRWVAHEGTPAADLIAALRQPVQQPAAVVGEVETKLAKRDAELYGLGFLLDGRRVSPERFTVFRPGTAPVPAAGVPPVCDVCSVYGAYGDGPFAQKCGACNTPPSAAGVQGDSTRIKPGLTAIMVDHHCEGLAEAQSPENTFDAVMEYLEKNPMDIFFRVPINSQPDSGRDAALMKDLDLIHHCANKAHKWLDFADFFDAEKHPGLENGRIYDAAENAASIMAIVARVKKDIAAHPAPSSDAAQGVFKHTGGKLYEKLGPIKAKVGDTGWWDAVRYRSVEDGQEYVTDAQRWGCNFTELAAHPANGAQAGCGKCPKETAYGPATCGKCLEGGAQAGLSDVDAAAIYDRAHEDYKEWYRLLDSYPDNRAANAEFTRSILAAAKKEAK